jgi:hypothetical protein
MYYVSSLNLDNISNFFGGGLSQAETQIQQMLSQLQSSQNVSPAQLALFQMQFQLWSNLILQESSMFKVVGDTTKQIVTNMGS